MAEQISPLLSAIASPQRIAILLAIGTGEACVCHLEASLGWRQAYISQHLMALWFELGHYYGGVSFGAAGWSTSHLSPSSSAKR
ncbi:MAG: winged helix-turn-helix transcriptional regulator [Chloroflexi bacterium]|nr:winged helix-turn-helix transcriptional regulator [Chloroflexota bacterium]